MRKIILASHGDLSKGIKNSMEMVVGEFNCEVEVYSLYPGGIASDYAEELEKEIKSNPEKEYIIITDLYGASVATAMLPLSMYDNALVFTGMCLGLVVGIYFSQDGRLSYDEAQEIIEQTKEGIQIISAKNLEFEEEDF